MTEEPSLAALEEQVAQILELPELEQAHAFERLREEHPQRRQLLLEWEAQLLKIPSPRRSAMLAVTVRGASAQLADRGRTIGGQIGSYRILETLGEGGMGTVYVAEQRHPLKRRVALKVIKLGMDSKAVVARFEQERQALALMDHEGIAKVFDCGTSERGQPFFVMELVRGIPLDRFCDQQNASLPERMQLMRQVCAAVQHAHHKGVVHRDLKPANVLVSDDGGTPQIKIIDFGLAKAMGSKLVEATLFTEAGQVVGTPEYMAPEQADPTNQDIDTRADIYSLGVILYKLLVDALPFSPEDLRNAGLLEIQRILREVDPPRPSMKLSSIGGAAAELARKRCIGVSALMKALRNDLDWLVLKALDKNRARRYETANALGADLQRFLDREPLIAGPPSASYRLQKLLLRYRRQFVGAGIVLLVLVAGGVSTFVQYLRAQANAERADAKVAEFDLLAGVVKYERAVAAERNLYPAWPLRAEDMDRWLKEECRPLLAMRGEVERTIERLREDALPLTVEERRRDRESHPRYAQWTLLDLTLQSLRHAHAIRIGKQQLVESELPDDQRDYDVEKLVSLALERVAPQFAQRRVWADEARGLAYARLAVQKAKGADRFRTRATLAWALVANGQDGEARRVALLAKKTQTGALTARFHGTLRALGSDLGRAYMAEMRRTSHLDIHWGDMDHLLQRVDRAAEALVEAEREHTALGAEVLKRRTWAFSPERPSDQVLHDSLVDLRHKLLRLETEQKAAVRKRLRWANRVDDLTRAHPKASHTWRAVRKAIAVSDKYSGLAISLSDEDVRGLVPLGANPVTGYQEFYHLQSAWDGVSDPRDLDIPDHDPHDGSIEVAEGTGIVFVLLPGGTVVQGSQANDVDADYYDPDARPSATVYGVELDPFFLARHEMTQGQWARLWSGSTQLREPSMFKPEDGNFFTRAHPVERVDWIMCNELLRRVQLSLPTEAQWEYGCRAFTKTVRFCSPEQLHRYANLAEGSAISRYNSKDKWGDAIPLTAPVGMFDCNAFGLYDVYGNVSEWCLDLLGMQGYERPGDGLRVYSNPSAASGKPRLDVHMARGGDWGSSAKGARSGARSWDDAAVRIPRRGLRAVRALRPAH